MNKFIVFSCVDLKDTESSEDTESSNYKGPVIILASSSDPNLMLFFPVTSENATVINCVLEENNNYDADTAVIGIYTTMLDSWQAGERFLSGIIIDTIFDYELNKEVPLIRLVLSDREGMIDSLVRVNFIHAILLAAMEKVEISVSDRLLNSMLPDDDDYDGDENNEAGQNIFSKESKNNFPEDGNIINIAKKIMEGKIREPDKKPDKKNKK